MILINKKVFEKRIYFKDDKTLSEWYKDIMLEKVKKKYKRQKDKLNKDLKLDEEGIIYFFTSEDKTLDLDLIEVLLTYDFIGELSNISEKPPKNINEFIWLKILGYYLLAKFVFYDLEKIEYEVLEYAKKNEFNINEYMKFMKYIYEKKVKEFNENFSELKIQPENINIKSNVTEKQNVKSILKKNIKNEINNIKQNVSIKLKGNKFFYKIKNKEINELKDIESFNKIISKVINYNSLSSSQRNLILEMLNVQVCPYCNRQYITSYKPTYKGKNKYTVSTADLDHFYPKSKFPLFSLSLYNFIPSCHICNSRMKSNKPIPILYPYEDFFDEEVKFEIVPKDKKQEGKMLVNLLYGKNDNPNMDNYEIKINISNVKSEKRKKYIQGSIEMFGLEEVYQSHKKIAAETIRTQAIYDNEVYHFIMNMLFNSSDMNMGGNKNISKEEISNIDHKIIENFCESEKNKILYGIDENVEDYDLKTPLSKFIRDMLNI